MPFAKDERLALGDDRRQRCQRAALAQRSRQMPRVVLASNRPAEREHAARKRAESFLDDPVDSFTRGFERCAAQRFARRNETRALSSAPALKLVSVHAILR